MSLRFPGLFGIVLLVGIVNFVLLYFLSIWLAPSMAKGGSVICKDTARKQALALKADEVHRIKGIIREKDLEIQRLRRAAAAATSQIHFYPIGVKGVPWGELERAEWLSMHPVRRSYRELVLTKIDALQDSGHFSVEAYGALSFDPERYPLLVIKSKIWDSSKPSVLVTGGVHGYETSGVEGALLFLQTKFSAYSSRFNFVVVPCVSPWGFEHIQRWNNNADDPNRGFKPHLERPLDECVALMSLLEQLSGKGVNFTLHMDLHETTDSDESDFRPARMARDGQAWQPGTIPDGFYLVGDSEEPRPQFHASIIAAVKQVTHIAEADEQGVINKRLSPQEGVVYETTHPRGLCAGVTGVCDGCALAPFRTTTEAYPDSPDASAEESTLAQVAAIAGALEFLLGVAQVALPASSQQKLARLEEVSSEEAERTQRAAPHKSGRRDDAGVNQHKERETPAFSQDTQYWQKEASSRQTESDSRETRTSDALPLAEAESFFHESSVPQEEEMMRVSEEEVTRPGWTGLADFEMHQVAPEGAVEPEQVKPLVVRGNRPHSTHSSTHSTHSAHSAHSMHSRRGTQDEEATRTREKGVEY